MFDHGNHDHNSQHSATAEFDFPRPPKRNWFSGTPQVRARRRTRAGSRSVATCEAPRALPCRGGGSPAARPTTPISGRGQGLGTGGSPFERAERSPLSICRHQDAAWIATDQPRPVGARPPPVPNPLVSHGDWNDDWRQVRGAPHQRRGWRHAAPERRHLRSVPCRLGAPEDLHERSASRAGVVRDGPLRGWWRLRRRGRCAGGSRARDPRSLPRDAHAGIRSRTSPCIRSDRRRFRPA